jgi:hypothetical protein
MIQAVEFADLDWDDIWLHDACREWSIEDES